MSTHLLQGDKLMLNRLLPEQVSKFWDIIKYAIEQSLPPIVGEHPDKMNRILSGALSGKVEVWASYNKEGNKNKFEGIVLTKILYDDASDTKNLLIYCLYGYERIDRLSWIQGLSTLVKYAKSKNCLQIIAYTDVPYLIDIVKRLGGEAKYTFVSFNVNEIIQNLNNLMERPDAYI